MIGRYLGTLAVVGALILPAGFSSAAIVISMDTYASEFDDDGAGDTAGPFLDPDTGVSGTITTVEVLDTAGTPGSFLDFRTTGQSGVGNTAISNSEAWTFKWNVDAQLLRIDFSSVGNEAMIGLQSDGWVGADITPGESAVQFDSNTGTFTMNGTLTGDTLDQTRMYGTSDIPVIPAGTEITLFSATGDSFSFGDGFTWVLIPEPASATLLALGVVPMMLRRRRQA